MSRLHTPINESPATSTLPGHAHRRRSSVSSILTKLSPQKFYQKHYSEYQFHHEALRAKEEARLARAAELSEAERKLHKSQRKSQEDSRKSVDFGMTEEQEWQASLLEQDSEEEGTEKNDMKPLSDGKGRRATLGAVLAARAASAGKGVKQVGKEIRGYHIHP